MNEDKFTIIDDNNISHDYYKLIQFVSDRTNKEYLIYTDSIDAENLYSNIIRNDNGKIAFIKLEDDIDRQEVEKAILQFNLEKEKKD